MESCGKAPLEIYRIEKFRPTLQPKDTYGKFYEGDSYVVLKKQEKEYDIHYWHGKECTADEMGSSAAFSVQLSGVLPMDSSHHLEEQMYEGEKFLSYFKDNGLQYLPGGIESGFKIVDPDKPVETRLLQCKGERYPRVFSVPVEANSINTGDVFILETNEKIYYWPGPHCNVNEKMKGLEVTTNMRKSERHCKVDVWFPLEDPAVDAEFWAILGGKPATINPPTSDAAAEAGDGDGAQIYKFYKVSNETGKLLCTEITERPLQRTHLDTNDTFILELHKQIYIWIGKNANVEEKKNALVIGKGFVQKNNKPKGTRVTRIVENAEDVHFKSFFNGFYPIAKREYGNEATTQHQDLQALANKKREQLQNLLNNLGKHTVKVYLIGDDRAAPEEIPESEYGHFFKDNTYMIDVKGEKHRFIIQWFGPRHPSEVQSAYRKYADQLTEGIHSSDITRLTVLQGHEDDSLLTFFPAGFVIHEGARQPVDAHLSAIKASGALYRVQGPFGEQPQAIQQREVKCELLNSYEAYVLVKAGGDAVFVWSGEGATADETAYAHKVAGLVAPGVAATTFKEKEETDDFWAALGGKTSYLSSKDLDFAPGFEVRLFQCSNATGFFYMNEIHNFQQEDLNNYDIMVLDAYKTAFVWVGHKSNDIERKNVFKKLQKFYESINDGRDPKSIQVVTIEPGSEPFTFKGFFPTWSDEYSKTWFELDPYSARMAEIEAEKKKFQESFTQNKTTDFLEASSANVFDLETLKTSLPAGVRPDQKEQYLSDADFQKVFGQTKDQFNQLKDWKKKDLKKKAGLF